MINTSLLEHIAVNLNSLKTTIISLLNEVYIEMAKKRICIYAKDVMLVTGRTERYGRKILKEIKEDLKKKKHQLVTIREFCDYMGLEIEEVEKLIH